jgi:hypothetical protein
MSAAMPQPSAPAQAGQYLDMPDTRRAAAQAHAAMLAETGRKVALDLPLQADVDDFRRILVAAAPGVRGGK